MFVGVVAWTLLDSLLSGYAAKRFSFDAIIYGTSSSSTRIENVLSLGRVWVQSPAAWLFGLGYYAFNGLFADVGSIYSHVLVADAIFELGFVGAFLLFAFIYLVIRDAIRLYRQVVTNPLERSASVILIAIFAYQFLLVNKQGNLWGSLSFFLPGMLISRFATTPRIDPQSQDQDLDCHYS
jgi:hypothetical protein